MTIVCVMMILCVMMISLCFVKSISSNLISEVSILWLMNDIVWVWSRYRVQFSLVPTACAGVFWLSLVRGGDTRHSRRLSECLSSLITSSDNGCYVAGVRGLMMVIKTPARASRAAVPLICCGPNVRVSSDTEFFHQNCTRYRDHTRFSVAI